MRVYLYLYNPRFPKKNFPTHTLAFADSGRRRVNANGQRKAYIRTGSVIDIPISEAIQLASDLAKGTRRAKKADVRQRPGEGERRHHSNARARARFYEIKGHIVTRNYLHSKTTYSTGPRALARGINPICLPATSLSSSSYIALSMWGCNEAAYYLCICPRAR